MNSSLKRFERKWVYYNNDHFALINELLRSKLFFNFNYPKRRVNSIYFDDSINSSVIENLEGNSKKKKIRIRWYGKQNKLLNPILKLISKFNSSKTKVLNMYFQDIANELKVSLKIWKT